MYGIVIRTAGCTNIACVGSHNKDSNYSFIVIPRHDEENSTWLSHTNWEAYFLDWV